MKALCGNRHVPVQGGFWPGYETSPLPKSRSLTRNGFWRVQIESDPVWSWNYHVFITASWAFALRAAHLQCSPQMHVFTFDQFRTCLSSDTGKNL